MRTIACAVCPVRAASVIADLPRERLDDFTACGTTLLYKPRQVLFHEGTTADGLYLLCRGLVKLHLSNRFGRDYIVAVVGPGEVFGELSLDGSPYSTSAEALSETQVRHLPHRDLGRLLQREPRIGLRLVEAMSGALGETRRKAAALALEPAEVRMAALLADLTAGADARAAGPIRITLGYSRGELAEMIGVSTETAIRLLARLERQGVLRTRGRELEIADVTALSRAARRAVAA